MGAALDRLDGAGNVAAPRYDEDGRRIIRRVELSQNIEPRLSGHANVEKNADWCPHPGGKHERRSVLESRRLVARQGKQTGQQIADALLIVGDEDFAAGQPWLEHVG